jgi:hypothetical protein
MTNLEIDIGAWDQTSEVHFQRSEVYQEGLQRLAAQFWCG